LIYAQGFSIIIVYIINGEGAIIGPMLRKIRWKRNVDEEHTSEPIKGIVNSLIDIMMSKEKKFFEITIRKTPA